MYSHSLASRRCCSEHCIAVPFKSCRLIGVCLGTDAQKLAHAQGELQLLKQSNLELNQQLASNEPMGPNPRSPLRQLPIALQPSSLKGIAGGTALPTSPTQAKPSGQQNQFSTGHTKTVTQAQSKKGLLAGELEHGCDLDQGEMRLQTLRKQLKRSAAECEALKADVAELKRRDRTADLYKNKVRMKSCSGAPLSMRLWLSSLLQLQAVMVLDASTVLWLLPHVQMHW